MISIYNETNTPWVAKRFQERLTIVEKMTGSNKPNVKTSRLGFLLHGTGLDNLDLSGYHSMYGSMKLPRISSNEDSLYWGHKDLGPVVTNLKHCRFKDFYLISVNLKSKILTDINSEGTWILDHYIMGGELTILVSLNEPDTSHITLVMANVLSNRLEKYKFCRRNGEPSLRIIPTNTAVNSKKWPMYKLKNYRPSYLTHGVIVESSSKQSFLKAIENCSETFNVVFLDDGITIENAVKFFKDHKYRAISIFVDDRYMSTDIHKNMCVIATRNFFLVHEAIYNVENDYFYINRLR